MPFAKPATGTTGWDDEVNAVIDRASDLDTLGYHPLSVFGAHSASCPPEAANSGSTLSSWMVRIWVASTLPITKVIIPIYSAAVVGSGGLNAAAVYNDAGTLLGQTASASSIWTTTGWSSANLTATIAAAAAGRFVRVVLNTEGLNTQPSAAFTVIGGTSDTTGLVLNGSSGARRCAFKPGYSGSFPSTIDPATIGTATPFMPLVMLG